MRKRLFGLLATTAIVFAACAGAATTAPSASESAAPSTAPSESAAPSATPQTEANLFDTTYPTRLDKNGTQGGDVIVADWQEANQWNPMYQSQVIEANITTGVWRSLVTTTDDFKFQGDLAADPLPTLANGGVTLGQGGDAMTVTWNLRPDQVWSDGQPITCDDMVATWKWIVDPDNSGLFAGLSGWEDITAIDCPTPTQAVIHFKNIYFDYLTMYGTASSSNLLPKHYITTIPVKDQVKGKGWSNAEMPNVPVSGPFKFGTITPGQELRLVRNDKYQNPLTGQPAWLDSVIFKWYGDADAMIAGYRGGEVDTAGDLTDGDLAKVLDLGPQVHPLDALQYEFLRPNWASPIMKDLAMRQALQYAVNKDEINTRLLGGRATVAKTNISPNAWYYSDPDNLPTFDPEKAKAILDAGGWKLGADGVRVKDGVRAEVKMCTTTRQLRQDTLALVSAWLKDVGIASTVNPVSAADFFASWNESTPETACNLAHGNYDVGLHTFSSALSPNANYPVYSSTAFEPKGQNDAKVSDPQIDQILNDIKNTVDFSKVAGLEKDWANAYTDKAVEIPLYNRKDVNLAQTYVKNWTGNPSNVGYLWNVQDWFVQK